MATANDSNLLNMFQQLMSDPRVAQAFASASQVMSHLPPVSSGLSLTMPVLQFPPLASSGPSLMAPVLQFPPASPQMVSAIPGQDLHLAAGQALQTQSTPATSLPPIAPYNSQQFSRQHGHPALPSSLPA